MAPDVAAVPVQPTGRRRRKLVALLVAFALVPLGLVAAQRGVAAAASHMLQEHLEHWLPRNGPADMDAWDRADVAFQFALRHSPQDPHLLQQGGRLYVWAADMEKQSPAKQEQLLDRAIEYYRASLDLRPAWPYAWMGLTLAKAHRSALDREFQNAFATTLQLGPREETIQLDMTRLGLRIWPALSFENQERLARNVRNAMASQPDKIQGVVREEHKEVFLCAFLQDDPVYERLCGKLELPD